MNRWTCGRLTRRAPSCGQSAMRTQVQATGECGSEIRPLRGLRGAMVGTQNDDQRTTRPRGDGRAQGRGPRTGHVGGIRGADGAAQRGLRRVLVHVLPHHGRPRRRTTPTPTGPSRSGSSSEAGRTPHWSCTATRRWPGASTARPTELPNIYHRKQYEESRAPARLPGHLPVRRQALPTLGLSAIALQGVLDLVAAAGGGVVEGYPHDNDGKKMSVLYNGTRALFERAGFTYDRPKGAGNCVMTKTVAAAG